MLGRSLYRHDHHEKLARDEPNYREFWRIELHQSQYRLRLLNGAASQKCTDASHNSLVHWGCCHLFHGNYVLLENRKTNYRLRDRWPRMEFPLLYSSLLVTGITKVSNLNRPVGKGWNCIWANCKMEQESIELGWIDVWYSKRREQTTRIKWERIVIIDSTD